MPENLKVFELRKEAFIYEIFPANCSKFEIILRELFGRLRFFLTAAALMTAFTLSVRSGKLRVVQHEHLKDLLDATRADYN